MIMSDKCPNCGSPLRLYARRQSDGRLVCTSCGYVIEESPIDSGPEWRSFTEEDRTRRSRVGAPLTERVHDKGLTTYIYAPRNDIRARKLIAIQASLRSHGHKKLIKVLQEANRVATRLQLPSRVAETMARIVRQLQSLGMIKKNNVNEYLAAAAVVAARIERHPLTMRDAADILGLNEQDVWRAYRRIVTRLKVRVATPPKPQMYVSRIASKLGLSGEVEALATRFTVLLARTGLAQGKPPEALAAAAVYVSSILLDQKRNQLTVAKAIGVTDATIRNRYRDIVDNFYIEVRL
ncbi:transcription initiation factor IIB family protein [Pyrodictium abyssi]|uniref:Transcription initiation factor IIB n=2 Tax=Pyrodictium abyssi TaxID=54256 RepID=A0ABN6ZQQ2_9CREN|nr:transcription initiation factor IIB family protein [Pyrodictium abyssi]